MEQNIGNTGDIIIYQTEDGLTKINVKLDNETVWLNQQQLVMLYQSSDYIAWLPHQICHCHPFPHLGYAAVEGVYD